ncbi:MAG: SAP domain-containing protein [Candidatus Thalassarchaeum sp.]
MEAIDEWTVAELRAELEELELVTTGNKQDLYDRLLDYEEEWGDDGDSGLSNTVGGIFNIVIRNRVALGAVIGVLLLLSAIVVAGPVVIDMIMPAEEEPPEVSNWEFSFEEKNWTEIQTFFVNDDSTETVSLLIPMPNNVSEVYIGAYWGEEDEEPGGIVGCDLVTVEVSETSVSKPHLYTLSSTDASSQDCDADKTEPWDKIWYHYFLDIPNSTGFEGTEEEARELWDLYNGSGTGEWRIDVSVDTYAVWGTVCDCEDGEDVRLTISYIEYEVKMSIMSEGDSPG